MKFFKKKLEIVETPVLGLSYLVDECKIQYEEAERIRDAFIEMHESVFPQLMSEPDYHKRLEDDFQQYCIADYKPVVGGDLELKLHR